MGLLVCMELGLVFHPGEVAVGDSRAFLESKRTTLPHRKNIRTRKSSPYYNRNALVKNISFYLKYNDAGKR